MKTILIIIVLLTSTLCFSQSQFRLNRTESFNFGVVIDPYASFKENGLNIGAEIEYSGLVYTRASITSFSTLNGGYLDLIGAFGVNFTSGMFERFRYYAGGRLGFIKRSGSTYPTVGLEAGIDYCITDNVFVGLRATYDKRSDFEFYGEPSEMRKSGYVKLGFKF
jgi:hypothetical protein